MKKRGRPKGSFKANKKQLKSYRLSEQEKIAVDSVLKSIRNSKPIPEYEKFQFDIISVLQNTVQIDNRTDERLVININKLLNIFVIWEEEEGFPFILKCKVQKSTNQSYFIRIRIPYYHKGAEPIHFNYKESCYQITKNSIDKSGCCYSSYSIALASLLKRNKYMLLNKLRYSNDIETYNTFLQILANNDNDLIAGLEFLARRFECDYLFRLENEF